MEKPLVVEIDTGAMPAMTLDEIMERLGGEHFVIVRPHVCPIPEQAEEPPPLSELLKAAMEAEALLCNYLNSDKFPPGSDCDEVYQVLRRAVREMQGKEKHETP